MGERRSARSPSQAVNTRRAKFQAVVLPNEAPTQLTAAEMTALNTFERDFKIRQAQYLAEVETHLHRDRGAHAGRALGGGPHLQPVEVGVPARDGATALQGDATAGAPVARVPCDAPERQYPILRDGRSVAPPSLP